MQARHYDPTYGRMYGNDPVGFTGDPMTFNRYAYANNNPYKWTDPTGMCGTLALDSDPNCRTNAAPDTSDDKSGTDASSDDDDYYYANAPGQIISQQTQKEVFEPAAQAISNFYDLWVTVSLTAIGGVAEATVARGAAATFFEGATLHPRVVAQLATRDNHAFPVLVDALAARSGRVTTVLDSRGQPVQMLTVDGLRNGVKGTYEYIKNSANQIYHRFFKPVTEAQ